MRTSPGEARTLPRVALLLASLTLSAALSAQPPPEAAAAPAAQPLQDASVSTRDLPGPRVTSRDAAEARETVTTRGVGAQDESVTTRGAVAQGEPVTTRLPGREPLAGTAPAPATPEQAALAAQLVDAAPQLRQFYVLRAYRPIWMQQARVEALVEALRGLEADGLTPADYRPEALLAAAGPALEEGAAPEVRARFELQASRALMTALVHLQRGKVDPRRLDPDWEVNVAPPSLDLLAISQALDEESVVAAMVLVRPTAEPYRRLRSALARYRNIDRLGGWPPFPARSTPLRPGDTDESVPLLRERLAMIGELEVMAADVAHYPRVDLGTSASRYYDADLAAAVRRFQARHLLATDGVVGPKTRAALNVPVAQRIDQIRANLERARWLLHGLPASFVLVDIAGYRLSYYRPNGETWRARIIVGRPYRRTPSLRSEITHLTLNPTWTVPPTILRNDILPEVRRDPGYLERHDMMVLSPSGRRLNPYYVDWWRPGNVMLRQRAGPRNPLGRLVIRFPNEHLVYLHDTPAQALFSRPQRALSSGCIRVEGVLELAQRLFDDTGTPGSVGALIASGQTRNVSLARRVPVVLHYWTVQPDASGRLAFRPDIYDRDRALIAALARPARSLEVSQR